MLTGEKNKLILVVLLAIVVRLVYCFQVYPRVVKRFDWARDDGYDEIAENVLLGYGYTQRRGEAPTTTRLPFYPLFLLSIYFFFGKSLLATQVIQSIVSGLSCIFIYKIGEKIFSPREGLLAALMFAFYSNSIIYVARPLTEVVYTLLLIAFTYFLLKSFDYSSPSYRYSIITGMVYGFLMLTKSTTVVFPLILLLLPLFFNYYRKTIFLFIKRFMVIFGIASLILLPWIWRNYALTGKFIPLATWGGSAFYHGYYVATYTGGFDLLSNADTKAYYEGIDLFNQQVVQKNEAVRNSPRAVQEYYKDKFLYSIVFETIRKRFLYSMWTFLKGFFLAWFMTYAKLKTIISIFIHIPILLLFIFSIKRLIKDKQRLVYSIPVLSLILYFNLIQGIIYPHIRYMSPVIPLTFVFISFGLLSLRFKQNFQEWLSSK